MVDAPRHPHPMPPATPTRAFPKLQLAASGPPGWAKSASSLAGIMGPPPGAGAGAVSREGSGSDGSGSAADSGFGSVLQLASAGSSRRNSMPFPQLGGVGVAAGAAAGAAALPAASPAFYLPAYGDGGGDGSCAGLGVLPEPEAESAPEPEPATTFQVLAKPVFATSGSLGE